MKHRLNEWETSSFNSLDKLAIGSIFGIGVLGCYLLSWAIS